MTDDAIGVVMMSVGVAVVVLILVTGAVLLFSP
jgi:hypothetical protein